MPNTIGDFTKCPKRKKQDWDAFRARVDKKGTGNNKAESNALEFLTVQRLSSSVEGKCQKYSRIGPLTMVHLNCEATLQNILKKHAKKHFQLTDMECDLLAGERGPSYTETSHIKNWKVLHIRFIEPGIARPDAPNRHCDRLDEFPQSAPASPSKSVGIESRNPPKPPMMPESMPLSAMLKLKKVITPKTGFVILTLEEFSVKNMTRTTSSKALVTKGKICKRDLPQCL